MDLTERLRRWKIASAETQALLHQNDELLMQRAQLLRASDEEFLEVVRLARAFIEEASRGDVRSAPRPPARPGEDSDG